MQKYFSWLALSLLCITSGLFTYDQPFINLGFTNILDGGPIRPTSGWYLYQYINYYGAHKFLDKNGCLLAGVPSPKTTTWGGITNLTYQTESAPILWAKTGFSLGVPYNFSSSIAANTLGLTDSGAGFGDLYGGTFLQWDPVMYKDRALFVSRLEINVSIPTGKYKRGIFLNPGNGFYFINPYWAATFYFTQKCAASWRLQYAWSSKSKFTKVQAGSAMFMNFDLEYEIFNNFWLAMVGYFLQQLNNSRVNGVSTPGRKEHVVAVGPGAFYERNFNNNSDLYLFGYLYFELDAKNRTQGISAIARAVYHF